MILQRLKEYAERKQVVQPPGYSPRYVKWELPLTKRGKLLKPVSLVQGEKGLEAKGLELSLPSVVRTSADAATLLADTGEYALGRPSRDDKQRREEVAFDSGRARKVANRHSLFRDLIDRCAAETEEPSMQVIAAFLSDLQPFDPARDLRDLGPHHPHLPEQFEFGDQVIFSVDDEYPTDLPSVKAFWERQLPGGTAADNVGICLVCGLSKPLLERMPGVIKGIPGGQSSGNALISANSTAFESYGLAHSLIAGCCRLCSEAFTAGLNALISDKTSSIRDAEEVAVFWTREANQSLNVGIVEQPTVGSVKELLESAQKATPAALSAMYPRDFYCLIMAASGSRIAIQGWIETSLSEAKTCLANYFLLQRLVGASAQEGSASSAGPPLRIWTLQRALLRSNAKGTDLPPKYVRTALLKTALTGASLPQHLLVQAVKRCQLEQRVTYERAVLIKMVLAQTEGKARDMSQTPDVTNDQELSPENWEALDLNNKGNGYLCGRALSVLDQIQRAALPTVKSTLVDRYFTGASQSPYTVFPRLIQNAQNHLGKLRNTGAGYALEKRLGEVLKDLKEMPRTLTLEGQAEFCLGYYHQREDDFLQARLRKAANDAAKKSAA